MSRIKNENYLVIQGWMINELNLKGNELIIFAIIYGFSQITGQTFNGNYQYLADWCNTTKRSAINIVNSLVAKHFLLKKVNKVNNIEKIELSVDDEGVKKFHWGSEKISLGSEKTSPINNIYNNNNINNNKKEEIYKEESEQLQEPIKEVNSKFNKKIALQQIEEDNWFNNYPQLKASVKDWICYKSERNQMYKQKGFNSLLTQLKTNTEKYSSSQIIEIIKISMANNYNGIIFNSLSKNPPNTEYYQNDTSLEPIEESQNNYMKVVRNLEQDLERRFGKNG